MFKRARAAVRVLQGESVRSVPESLSPDLFTFAKVMGFLRAYFMCVSLLNYYVNSYDIDVIL